MQAPTPVRAASSSARDRAPLVIGAITLLVTLVPYLVGSSIAGSRRFLWLGYNLDDSCVYLSWLRQTSQGSIKSLNLFTTSPQHGMLANPLFLMLGWISRLFHLPLLATLHASRLIFGAGLLLVSWKLICYVAADHRARLLAFLFVCFGSGFGWIPGLWPAPIDAWQPEAITFLSLYLSPLFCFSLMLQVWAALLFLRALDTDRIRYAVWAGLAIFVLALTHTYDVITMLAIISAFAVIAALGPGRSARIRPLLFATCSGLIAAPPVIFIVMELKAERVFHQRMEVPTGSGPIINLLLGYGPLLALALFAGARAVKRYCWKQQPPDSMGQEVANSEEPELGLPRYGTMLAAWAVVNIGVSYLPLSLFPFQRKMLQGAHIPIAILAGYGAAYLAQKAKSLNDSFRFYAAAGIVTVLFGISNIMFMLRDVDSFEGDQIQTTHMHRPYIEAGEAEALEWIERNTQNTDAVQPLPWVALDANHFAPVDITLACLTPGFTGRTVYCGHWGETPNYQEKLAEIDKLGMAPPRMTDDARLSLLKSMKVKYVLFSQKQPDGQPLGDSADELMPIFRDRAPLPHYLTKVYSNADADIYRVDY